jgi:hypothetical protein
MGKRGLRNDIDTAVVPPGAIGWDSTAPVHLSVLQTEDVLLEIQSP